MPARKGGGLGSAAAETEAREPVSVGNAAVSKASPRNPQAVAFHPLADLFPLIEGDEFAALVDAIRAHGLREPVVLFEGQILDGRNRFRACQAAGIPCRFERYQGGDPMGYVVSLNLRRRHLDESQRAMVAAKLATLRDGQRADLVEGLPIGRASELLNVGDRSVARAREVLAHGVPELRQAVERGTVSVSAAADLATESAEAQREIVARGEREILEAAKEIRGARAEARRTERIARIAAISGANSPLPQDRKYPVILADPPWHFEVYNEDSGVERAAANHYPTMSLSEICKLPIVDLTTPDAALFLWTTAPHLHEAFEVLAAWGFQYVSNFVWVKDKFGFGYWVRNQHELVLIARRGDMPTPAPACRPPSVIQAPVREHSRKPEESYGLIERMYPGLPKLELFARARREGWSCWGNEAPAADPAEGRAMTRQRLPNRRLAETFELTVGGLHYTCTVGRFSDGSIGELFLNNHKSNSAADTNARDAAIVFSIAVQCGADVETIRKALCRDGRGNASGPLGCALDRIAADDGAGP